MSGVTPEFNLFHRLLWPEFHDSLLIKVDITAFNVVNTKFPDTFLTISQISFQFPAKMFFLAFVLSNAYYSFCQEISWQVEAMNAILYRLNLSTHDVKLHMVRLCNPYLHPVCTHLMVHVIHRTHAVHVNTIAIHRYLNSKYSI